jgi:hypothetical protein
LPFVKRADRFDVTEVTPITRLHFNLMISSMILQTTLRISWSIKAHLIPCVIKAFIGTTVRTAVSGSNFIHLHLVAMLASKKIFWQRLIIGIPAA